MKIIWVLLVMMLVVGCSKYDYGCIDRVADRVCKEEGFDRGDMWASYTDRAACYNHRDVGASDVLKMFDEEIAFCEKNKELGIGRDPCIAETEEFMVEQWVAGNYPIGVTEEDIVDEAHRVCCVAAGNAPLRGRGCMRMV